ncbi:MAG: hypothetical protein K6G69_08700 [Lachnospiraceae bacterium]|nr:hypothetical protein [Lachnospiraceae bacterium]
MKIILTRLSIGIIIFLLCMTGIVACSKFGKDKNDGTLTDETDGKGADGKGKKNTKKGNKMDQGPYIEWNATEKLADKKPEKLSIDADDAKYVPISFVCEKGKDENYNGSDGGADYESVKISVCYDTVDDPAGLKAEAEAGAIPAIMDDYNAWVDDTVKSELARAVDDWNKYRKKNPDSYINLTPHIGLYLTRSDTRVISFISSVDRYNRGFAGNDYVFHGHTYDAKSGRELSLADFFTDTDKLAELVCVAMSGNYDGSKEKPKFQTDEYKDYIKANIDGCRDDGNFAWAVDPVGVEFVIVFLQKDDDLTNKYRYRVYVPFAMCDGILRDDAYLVGYDNMTYINSDTIPILWENAVAVNKADYYDTFLVRKDGKEYLYLCNDKETVVYAKGNDSPIGRMNGVATSFSNRPYSADPDPNRFTVKMFANIVREEDLKSVAKVGDDGVPVLLEPYHLDEWNFEPFMATEDFEAEIFADENATEPEMGIVKKHTMLMFFRTDGKTYIDMWIGDESKIVRLYIGGDDEKGWTVNGHKIEDIIKLNTWIEE